ncbi:hypothetical protein F5882DRAFT_140741 [Hyaloscypha sp. PMI_1271]|nr:hypothetical protein F5882DRAFT_140741 [Hyaloscypha sp. PMI_1271]
MSEIQDHRAQSQASINHQYDHPQDSHTQASHVQGRQGSVDEMAGQYGTPDGSMAPRKRSKVSRACDECRRKKIRCDATSESGEDSCTSCKRVGTTCQFSRVPMKRGPSKGYIKELADRLGQLEGAMQASEMPVPTYLHDSPLQRRGSEDFSPPPSQEHHPKKRTYSSVSGSEFGTPYLAHRSVSAWPTHESPRHLPAPGSGFAGTPLPPVTSQAFRDPMYSPNGLAPLPQWKAAPEPPRRQSAAFENAIQDQAHSESPLEWDDTTVDSYYKIMHPTFPLLSQSKARLNSRWSSYPVTLRDALYSALHSAVNSFPSATSLPENKSSRKGMQLWFTAQLEAPASRSFATNLAYLQILLLLAIEAGNRVPGAARGQAALSQSVWLGNAVGLAYEMKLYEYKAPLTDDPDSDERLGRRIWWSLVIMDRWHAASMSTPLLVSDNALVLMPEDQSLLGESLFHLTRKSAYFLADTCADNPGLSIILGHYLSVPTTSTEIPSLGVPPFAVYGTLLRGELERWREVLPDSLFNSPLIHLCFWYIRIVLELKQADSDHSSLLTSAMKIVTQLTHNSNLVTPLTCHSTVLATLILIKLSEYDGVGSEAESGLKTLMENRIAPSAWDSTVRDMISNRKQAGVPGSAESKHVSTAAQGLQHLAELATANEEGRDVAMGESRSEGEIFSAKSAGVHNKVHPNFEEIMKNGYLRALSGESGR